jgi:hypothetical protein
VNSACTCTWAECEPCSSTRRRREAERAIVTLRNYADVLIGFVRVDNCQTGFVVHFSSPEARAGALRCSMVLDVEPFAKVRDPWPFKPDTCALLVEPHGGVRR